MRKHLLLCIIVIAAFFLSVANADAATYYVAKTGNDTNNTCTEATSVTTPKLTIKAGIGCLSGGDTLIIKAGTYAEVDIGLTNPKIPSGLSDTQRTVVKGAPGETIILQPTSGNGALYVYSATYVTLDGLIFDGALVGGYPLYIGRYDTADAPSTYITLQNSTVRNSRLSGFSVGFRQNQVTTPCNIRVINVRSHDNGRSGAGHGIYSSCRNVLIDGGAYARAQSLVTLGSRIPGPVPRCKIMHSGREIERCGYVACHGVSGQIIRVLYGAGQCHRQPLICLGRHKRSCRPRRCRKEA
jgi:hypothetical protein